MSDQPEAGFFRDGVHILPIRVYYEDTDFTGIVYHANYLRYFERGRSEFLRLLGALHDETLGDGAPAAWTIIRVEIDYLKPARVDDVLEVHTTYTRATGARLFAAQAVKRGGVDLVRGQVQAACLTPNGRPVRIPAAIREKLVGHASVSTTR